MIQNVSQSLLDINDCIFANAPSSFIYFTIVLKSEEIGDLDIGWDWLIVGIIAGIDGFIVRMSDL